MISLGKYSFVIRVEWLTMPLMALLTAPEKNIQGSNAENTNNGYGTPSLLTLATREKTRV